MFNKKKSNASQVEKLSSIGRFDFIMTQNSPNPVVNKTKICFAIPVACRVKIALYNKRNEEKCLLIHDFLMPGYYRLIWNGKNQHNQRLRPGQYSYMLQAGVFVATRQISIQ